ncbi:MAG: hypothetical protein AMXMBFR84_16710 [Candidatus Hydrogenedentota bacterium]
MVEITFDIDQTQRLSCRAGDLLGWFRLTSAIYEPPAWGLHDAWYTRDGDYVTVTSRSFDLPSWVELHPTEMSNLLGMRWVNNYNAAGANAPPVPDAPMDAPNLWRLRAGDRMGWVTTPRYARNPVATIILFDASAMAILETVVPAPDIFRIAGGFPKDPVPENVTEALRECLRAIERKGLPRVIDTSWSLEY